MSNALASFQMVDNLMSETRFLSSFDITPRPISYSSQILRPLLPDWSTSSVMTSDTAVINICRFFIKCCFSSACIILNFMFILSLRC